MKISSVFRKITTVVIYGYPIIGTLILLSGNATKFDIVLTIVSYALLAINLILCLILYVRDLDIYLSYKIEFGRLKQLHTEKYRMYLAGNVEQVQKLENEFLFNAEAILNVGQYIINSGNFRPRLRKNVTIMQSELQKMIKSNY